MYLGFTTLLLNVASSYCYATFEMFHGFDAIPANSTTDAPTTLMMTSTVELNETLGTTSTLPVTSKTSPTTTLEPTSAPILPVISSKFQCLEEEQPSNIGAYEVPTQRDIVLLVRDTLTRMFNNYHVKALYFLKDIKEASKATAGIEKKCQGYGTNRVMYRQCVRQVSNKCDVITKSLVTALESQRLDVEAFTNGTVCSVKGMKADPVELIKTLAMEEASLEFALPGFLRLLSACSIYCSNTEPQQRPKKPLRHMTDQDLVVKHFLTKKSYIQLIKGSK